MNVKLKVVGTDKYAEAVAELEQALKNLWAAEAKVRELSPSVQLVIDNGADASTDAIEKMG